METDLFERSSFWFNEKIHVSYSFSMFFFYYFFERRCPSHPIPSWGSCASFTALLCTWHLQVPTQRLQGIIWTGWTTCEVQLIEQPKHHRRLTHFEEVQWLLHIQKKKKKSKAKFSLLFFFPTCQLRMQKQGYMKVSLLFLLWFLYSPWLIASTAVLVEPNRLQPRSFQMTSDWWDATLL